MMEAFVNATVMFRCQDVGEKLESFYSSVPELCVILLHFDWLDTC
jgi:hypothetical protein